MYNRERENIHLTAPFLPLLLSSCPTSFCCQHLRRPTSEVTDIVAADDSTEGPPPPPVPGLGGSVPNPPSAEPGAEAAPPAAPGAHDIGVAAPAPANRAEPTIGGLLPAPPVAIAPGEHRWYRPEPENPEQIFEVVVQQPIDQDGCYLCVGADGNGSGRIAWNRLSKSRDAIEH